MRPLPTAALAVLALAGAATAGPHTLGGTVRSARLVPGEPKSRLGTVPVVIEVDTLEVEFGTGDEASRTFRVGPKATVRIGDVPGTPQTAFWWVSEQVRGSAVEFDVAADGKVSAARFKAAHKVAGRGLTGLTDNAWGADKLTAKRPVTHETGVWVWGVTFIPGSTGAWGLSVTANEPDPQRRYFLSGTDDKTADGKRVTDAELVAWLAAAKGRVLADFTIDPDSYVPVRAARFTVTPWSALADAERRRANDALNRGEALVIDKPGPAGPITDARELILAGGAAVEKAGTAAAKFERAADAAPAAIEKLGRIVLLTAVLLGAIAGLAAALAFRLATRPKPSA